MHSSSAQIRLPTFEMHTFGGNACNWLHFRDTFEALIVKNQVLSNVQRFLYLTTSLKGEAKELIVNLPITNDNFFGCMGIGNTTLQQQQINSHETC
jgi:hypothetical protein